MNFRKFFFVSACAMLLASPAMAQTTTTDTDPGHPRVNEVDQRIQDQQSRTANGVDTGTIASPQRAAADEARDSHVANEARRDEAANNGHLTKQEQRRMNRQLNRNSKHIYTQKHNQ
jgi:hypothetical protein